jgi:hypothetical protein
MRKEIKSKQKIHILKHHTGSSQDIILTRGATLKEALILYQQDNPSIEDWDIRAYSKGADSKVMVYIDVVFRQGYDKIGTRTWYSYEEGC